MQINQEIQESTVTAAVFTVQNLIFPTGDNLLIFLWEKSTLFHLFSEHGLGGVTAASWL